MRNTILNGCFCISAIAGTTLISGCAGYGGQVVNAAGNAAVGAAVNGALGGQGGIVNAVIQSMARSVIYGQIGQQVAPLDQNFRLNQLGNMLQSGKLEQNQQWSNPQTGNSIAINPIGQQALDPYSQQNCRNLEEVYTNRLGPTIRENRRACQNAAGQWVMVQ